MDHSTGPHRRAPETREAALARAANDYICPNGSRRPFVAFGAPVTSTEIVYYEKATKILCKTRPPGRWFAFKRKTWPLGQWFGFENDVDAARQLGKVARGMRRASSLPTHTSNAFTQLDAKLDELYRADGRENKTWPRKHAVVLHALLTVNA
jgi:hypothetical protein